MSPNDLFEVYGVRSNNMKSVCLLKQKHIFRIH